MKFHTEYLTFATKRRREMINITDTLNQITGRGGKVLTPRTDIGSGLGAFAAFRDPAGAEFGLYEEPPRS